MIELSVELVQEALKAPEGWVDTPEQAQLRECLTGILAGHSPIDTLNICHGIVTLMRDQLMNGAALVRRSAALKAKIELEMTPREIAAESGQTLATIARLLNEARM